MPLQYNTTADIDVSKKIIDQVIGQESASEIIKKAAEQRRHVLLIGEPGTGKSMLGIALAELLPKEKLVDVVAFSNVHDENQPLIRTVPAGKGRELVARARIQNNQMFKGQNVILFFLVILSMFVPWWARTYYKSDIIFAALFLGSMMFLGTAVLFMNMGKRMGVQRADSPKIVVDNYGNKSAPFLDATGAHAGALLGDILHDPFQCIPGDEFVHLDNGCPLPIAELVDPFLENQQERTLKLDEQFDVLGSLPDQFGYNATTVTKVYRRLFNGKLVVLETRRGYKLRVTPNHPIAILNESGGIKFIRADNLCVGMKSVVPDKLPITAKGKLSTAMINFLAEALSDGCIKDSGVTFKVRTPWKAAQYMATIRAIGRTPKLIQRGKDTEVYVNSVEVAQELLALGAKRNGRKHIPSVLFSLSRDQIMIFLARYFSIDGYVGKQGQFELVSRELIPEMTALLLKCGVRAKVRPRLDHGFGKSKGIIQPRIIFGDYDFVRAYRELTINPTHRRNLDIYLVNALKKHVSQDDVMPVGFDWLEAIRKKSGLSQEKVHPEYYSLKEGLKTSRPATRGLLQSVVSKFLAVTNDAALFKLRDLSQGTFAYDDVISVSREKYRGHVYNLTTKAGTYVVSQVLTHNTGGLGTPAHERVVAGMIHKANLGVLFVDEIATLDPGTQQELLTALQEGKYQITGQSERSAGAMVRTEAVPCNFILVAAGNLETVSHMHPALRSRIRGYGYEVFMQETMPETPESRDKIAVFIAQEVVKDKKIPHFAKDAVEALIQEARRMANRKGHLTLRFRELGGLIRAAGDLARADKKKFVTSDHVAQAKKIARPLEQQLADRFIERKKEYEIIVTEGKRVGRVNGLAVIGAGPALSGIILPIEAEVVPGGKEKEIVATGKLGQIAQEAVKNVSAIIKNYFGKDIKQYDIYVQFLQTYEGVEGDSASIAVAIAIISSLTNVPIKQTHAMTGSLSVRGDVLPIGGVSAKVEAAIDAGITTVLVPKTNMKDIVIGKERLEKIKILPMSHIKDVLKEAMDWKGHPGELGKLVAKGRE